MALDVYIKTNATKDSIKEAGELYFINDSFKY